jgi:hypothetical protein
MRIVGPNVRYNKGSVTNRLCFGYISLMADQNNLKVLSEVLEYWTQQGVGAINWARQYPPDTPVTYADVPDLLNDGVTTPRWDFETSVGRVSFILSNGDLEPEDIFDLPGKGVLNHHSRMLDIQSDFQGFIIFGSPERHHFRTDVGYAWSRLSKVANSTSDSGQLIEAWSVACDTYTSEVQSLIDSIKRRRQILTEMGHTSTRSYFSTHPLKALVDLTGDLLSNGLHTIATDASVWTDLDGIPQAERQRIILKLYTVPGGAKLLDGLARQWNLHGWATLSSVYDTSDWVRTSLSDDAAIRLLVQAAIGCDVTDRVELPSLDDGLIGARTAS